MPTYQYACTVCGHQFEAVQSFAEASLTECPACAGQLRKLYSAVGIVFKGSGFYRTDSRAAGTGKTGSASDSTAGSNTKDKAAAASSSSSSGSSSAASSSAGGSSGTSSSSTSSSTT